MAADPISAVSNAVSSVFEFATAGLEIYQERVAARRGEREQAESAIVDARRREEDRQLAREQYVQVRRDQSADDARNHLQSLERDQIQRLFKNYPVRDGPGSLRAAVQRLYPDLTAMPPLVLFVPSHQDGDPAWRPLPLRLRSALMPLQDDRAALVRWTDRLIPWPHDALIAHDLADLPTLLVSADVVAGELELRLGGCNLGGSEPIRNLTQVVRTQLPTGDYWTPERLDWFESTSTSGFRRPSEAAVGEGERRVQFEWAVRLGHVAIVAAIDAYHLLRRTGYAEKLDDALDLLEQSMADRVTIPYPAGALADPFHHDLHQVRRLLQRGSEPAARAWLEAAFERLGGCPAVGVTESIRSARSADRIQPWHRDLLRDLRPLLPPDALEALDRPSATVVRAEPVTSGPPRAVTALEVKPASVSGEWVGHPLRRTRVPQADDPAQVYEGRPVKRTRGDEAGPDAGVVSR
ncbi:hypothetical protein [Streptomyces sp. SID13031]|uniref:hypothetical protein n=1 Tax=Streptomyces sp. SID13031 TaxID=2706046 RepID=UPI0013CAF1FD|nr:hypothetical protein [Streptomyces sp. SID13031]NEA30707.1 hypothetical protein [Streptomyces sp. SID13031]